MSFTLTGHATDLDLDVTSLPTATAQVLAPWTAEDGTLRTSHATGRFDETGALVKDDGGPWVVGAPEAAPMYVKASGLPSLRFPAPADGATVDLADLYADHSPLPAPSPTTSYVRGASAYEVAVAEGFVGTEAEWLATLEGEDGEPGIDGTAAPHASTHASGGSDPISAASIGAVASDDPRLRDTGLRQITAWDSAGAVTGAPLPAGWRPKLGLPGGVTVRRRGPFVTVTVSRVEVAVATTTDQVWNATAGFRAADYASISVAMLYASGSSFRPYPMTNALNRGPGAPSSVGEWIERHTWIYDTNDPWPATPPGTPA